VSSSTQVPRSISAAEARSNLGQIIRRASGKNPERFVNGLRGGPKAILMELEDYPETITPPPDFLAEMHAISIANGQDRSDRVEAAKQAHHHNAGAHAVFDASRMYDSHTGPAIHLLDLMQIVI
jgi:ADP-dependent phosphofructokinase/glucokinase